MKVLLAILALVLAACSPTDTVVRVIDGDTVEMASGEVVRLAGIDTPEKGQCGFSEASDRLAALVEGQSVTLTDAGVDDEDRYGRLIRYIDVEDQDAGLILIQEGLAIARYDSRDGYGEHLRENEYVHHDAESEGIC